MKTRIIAILISIVAFCSCWSEAVPVTGVAISDATLTMDIGETKQLTARVLPTFANNQVIHWQKSAPESDIEVIDLDRDGNVTALATGQAYVIAISDEGGLADTCVVSVRQVIFDVESLSISPENILLQKGEEAVITTKVLPENATNPALTWRNTNENVVSFTPEDGKVVALNPGSASIIATTLDGGFTAECKITVEQHVKGLGLVFADTDAKAENIEFELNDFKPVLLKAVVTPEDAEDKSVVWSSTDEKVVKVSGGLVSAVGIGEADIKVKTQDGALEESCHVVVKCKVTGVSLSEHKLLLKVGATEQLVAEVLPANAGNKAVEWESSKPEVASVSYLGLVTALASGTTEVRVKTAEGDFKQTCTVTVEKNVTGVSLNKYNLSMVVDDEDDLVATVEPEGVTNAALRWSSSDSKVASVNDKGHVIAINAGEAVICATTQDGGYHANCTVKVRNKVDKINVYGNATSVYIGKTVQLRYELVPADAGNIPVEWSSEDPSIAKVDQNGLVTGVSKAESVKIYVSTTDHRVSGYFTLQVLKAVTGISVSEPSISLYEGDSKPITVTVSPEDATETGYTVSQAAVSGGEAVFANSTSTITAVKPGVVTFTFKPKDPAGLAANLSATCRVEIWRHVTGVSIGGDAEKTVILGESVNLTANVEPSNAHDKSVTWESSDESIVSLGERSGSSVKITAKAAGDATIIVTTTDRQCRATCTIHVKPKANSITLSDTELDLLTGDEHTLTATVLPENANDRTVRWISDKPSVASVDPSSGKVTAKTAGTAVITAISNSDEKVQATCSVKVTKKIIHVESVSLSESSLKIMAGESATLEATVKPADADNKNVTWSSSNTLVAEVDQNGNVTTISIGTAVITVTTEDGGFTDKCNITVTPPPVHVNSVTLSQTELTLFKGDTHTLTVTVKPNDADDKSVTWDSEDKSVATVTQEGVVTAVSPGTTNIIVQSNDDDTKFAICSVTVKKPISVHVTGLSIDPTSMSLYVNQTKKIKVTVTPSNADDKSVTFQFPVASAIKVDSEGNVTGVKEGSAQAIVKTNDGGKTKTCIVTVTMNPVVGIEVKLPDNHVLADDPTDTSAHLKEGIVLRKGESMKLTATALAKFTDGPVSIPGLTWSIVGASRVSVNSGLVTALSAGDTKIRIKSNEANSTVYVDVPVTVLPEQSEGDNPGIEFDDWNF